MRRHASAVVALTTLLISCALLAGCTRVVAGKYTAADKSGPHLIKAGDIGDLMLSPSKIDSAVGESGMTVQYTASALVDHSTDVNDSQCTGLLYTAEQTTFPDAPVEAVGVRNLLSDDRMYFASQAIVLLPKLSDAREAFSRITTQWQRCANRVVTDNGSNFPLPWEVGALEQADGLLTLRRSLRIIRINCQRAVRLAANAIIDVSVCAPQIDSPARTIATEISAGVPL